MRYARRYLRAFIITNFSSVSRFSEHNPTCISAHTGNRVNTTSAHARSCLPGRVTLQRQNLITRASRPCLSRGIGETENFLPWQCVVSSAVLAAVRISSVAIPGDSGTVLLLSPLEFIITKNRVSRDCGELTNLAVFALNITMKSVVVQTA